MINKKKIILLSSRFPNINGKADAMTLFYYLKFLSKYHDVTLFSFIDKNTNIEKLNEIKCKIYVEKLTFFDRILYITYNLIVNKFPLQTLFFKSKKYEKKIKSLGSFDVAYCHLIRMEPYLNVVNAKKKILAYQISQTLNLSRLIKNAPSIFYKILYTYEKKLVEKYEKKLVNKYDINLIIGKKDAIAIEGIATKKKSNFFLLPHGINLEEFKYKSPNFHSNNIVFCGVLETPTNIAAVIYFSTKVMPLLLKINPKFNFIVLGRNPSPIVKRLHNVNNTNIIGEVIDIKPYYYDSFISVAPIKAGAGMQNKIITSFSLGVPCVSTTVANEGIGGINKKHILLSNSAREFSSNIIFLKNNKNFYMKQSKLARDLVEEKWSWEYYLQKLNVIISRL